MLTNKENKLKYCRKVVKRLIMQYREYKTLINQVKELENKKFTEILKNKNSKSIKTINRKISLIKKDLNQVSDEMTFANHIIWIMYKYAAYKNKSNEISTLGDFRKHCSPKGYICTKRFQFLCKYLRTKYKLDINNKKIFPDQMELKDFFEDKRLINLLEDLDFMEKWKENEYLKTKNKVNKWNTLKLKNK